MKLRLPFRGAQLARPLILLAAGLGWLAAAAQVPPPPTFRFRLDGRPPLATDGPPLPNAWAGGLNAAQYSTIRLNDDTLNDLVTFDRTNNVLTTFVAAPTASGFAYHYAPQYARQFPALTDWMLLADYDGDGRKDLFAHANLGIVAYRNVSVGGILRWEMVADPINTQGLSGMVNLQVPATDLPALTDLDGDGDLDILTYDFSGNYVQLHRNVSRENHGNASFLEFERAGPCWGNFGEGTSCNDFTFGVDCSGSGRVGRPVGGRVAHAGSTLLLLDLDGDGRQDILTGDVECTQLFALPNEGTNLKANFTRFRTDFPTSRPADFPTFPGAFVEDVNFDGLKDLLVTPNLYDNEANQVDFRASNWLYLNRGTNQRPDFLFEQPDFLQNQMLDVGENAAPALADYDGDGDQDLFVGNGGTLVDGSFAASVAWFRNVGTAQRPAFALADADFLGLRASGTPPTNLRPFFADLNADGAPDFCFVVNEGRATILRYVPNQAARQQPMRFDARQLLTYPLPLEPNDAPALFDADRDGDLDALVGKSLGNLAFYRNNGPATSPRFVLENENFGALAGDATTRSPVPCVADLDRNGIPDLLVGNRSGRLSLYANFLANLAAPLVAQPDFVHDSLTRQYGAPRLGSPLFPTAADLDGDQLPELIVGSNAGGLLYLANESIRSTVVASPTNVLLYPNPAAAGGALYVNPPFAAEASLFTVLGQRVGRAANLPANRLTSWPLGPLAPGVYVLRLVAASGAVLTQRVIIQ